MCRISLFIFALALASCLVTWNSWESETSEAIKSEAMSGEIVHVEFEVYGMVQGVFFRKHTVDKANQLGLRGWCMNTSRGTVLGQMEGEPGRIEEMKRWLKFTGSPLSKIEKAEFRDEKPVDKYNFSGFKVRH